MKRLCVLLFMLLLTLPCAAETADITTPRTGVAVAAPGEADGTAAMYELPDEDGDVLMGFYQGAVLEVLGLEKNGMVRVQSGEAGASVQGYMKQGDLRYGEMAMRELAPYTMNLRMRREATVYAYPDALSGEVVTLKEGDAFSVKGISPDGWGQIEDVDSLFFRTGDWLGEDAGGFIRLETGLAIATVSENPRVWHILPAPGEMTAQDALARAIELMSGMEESGTRLPAEIFTRESLEAMWADVRLVYDGDLGEAQWEVYLQTPDAEYGFNVYLTIDGELDRIEVGNG